MFIALQAVYRQNRIINPSKDRRIYETFEKRLCHGSKSFIRRLRTFSLDDAKLSIYLHPLCRIIAHAKGG
jgi:hypothetical protein